MLGSITPGESIRNAKGSSQILIPVTDFVVQGKGVYFANALRLLNLGVVYLNWLMRVDFPTLGIPQIISHNPTVVNFALLTVWVNFKISLKLRRFLADMGRHLMPTDQYLVIILLVDSWSQRSYLLKRIIFSLLYFSMRVSKWQFLEENGALASLISRKSCTSDILSSSNFIALCM